MDKQKEVAVECLINNIWTSRGKIKFGESIEVPEDEAKDLKAKMRKILKERFG